jgi:hypothetical protein
MNPDVLSRKTGREMGRMRLALLATVACAALAAPAAAQWGSPYNTPALEAPEDDGDAMVPPQRIMRWVARQGYAEVTQPRLNGSSYVIDGIADDGSRMRFTIDAYDGQLISSRPVGRVADVEPGPGLRPPGMIPRGGPPEFGEAAPVPPGVIPRRGAPEVGEAAALPPRGGPPEFGEAAPRPRPPVAGAPAPAPAPRQAMREAPPAASPPGAGGVYGVNPGSVEGAAKPAAKPAARPPRAAAVAPAAPPASAAPAAPAAPAPAPASPAWVTPAPAPKPEATASAPRGPVRVIGGVTPVLPKTEGPAEVRIPEPPPVPPPALQ